MTAFHRLLLLLQTHGHVDAVVDAVGVGDDQRRTVIGLGFLDGLDGLLRVGADGDTGDVDRAEGGEDQAHVLLGRVLAAGSELGNGRTRGGFRHLAAGVGVHLGVHDQDVDVLAGGEHVIHTAVADVIGPAVTADDPDGLLHQVVGHVIEPLGDLVTFALEGGLQFGDPGALGLDLALLFLRGADECVGQFLLDQTIFDSLGQQFERLAGQFVHCLAHTQTVLGVVLEQRVGPGRSTTVGTLGVRGGGQVAGVDGRTAGGVGGQHAVADHLGDEFDVRGLATACAGAGELEQRPFELAALDGADVDQAVVDLGQGQEGLPVLRRFRFEFLGIHRHGQGAGLGLLAVRTFLAARADGHAQGTAAAVGGGHLNGELHVLELLAHRINGLEGGIGAGGLEGLGGGDLHADAAVRTDQRTAAALDAGFRIPLGYLHGDVAFLPLRRRGRPTTVVGELGNRDVLAVAFHHLGGDGLDKVRGLGRYGGRHFVAGHLFRHLDLDDVLNGAVHRAVVHLDDLVALDAVGLLDGVLDRLDCLFLADDAGDGEEGGLHDHVDAGAQAEGQAEFDRIDDVELDLLLDQLLLHQGGQVIPDLVLGEGGGQEEGAARLQVGQHVVGVEEGRVVAGDEVGLVDQVRGDDLVLAETQVRNGHGTGFLRVVDKVALGGVVRLGADDLDGVFVGADRAVRAKTVEQGAEDVLAFDVEGLVVAEAGEGEVVIRADAEFLFRCERGHVVEHGLDHGRGELGGTQTVTAVEDHRDHHGGVGLGGLGDRGADIEVERVAVGARLLGAVEHGDALDGRRQGVDHGGGVERPEQADDDQADLPVVGDEVLDGGGDGQGAGTHDHDDIGGVRGADVVKQVVLPTGEGGKLVHVGLDDGRHGIVILVHGLAAGEVHVRVLGGTADGRTVRGQGALAVGDDQVFVDHGAHVVHGQLLDLHDLVGGAEAVEEVDEGNARLQGGLGGDQGKILGFLNVLGTQQAPAGLAGGHDITVVAEDGQTLAGDGAGGYMEDRGDQLAGDLVHVGDHEQQALGGGEGGAQCTSAQRTVNGAGHTGLGLHLGDDRDGAPDVLLLGGGLGVRFRRHRRGRRDGIDGYDFTCGICDVRTCLVSVNSDHFSRHKIILLTRWLVFSGNGAATGNGYRRTLYVRLRRTSKKQDRPDQSPLVPTARQVLRPPRHIPVPAGEAALAEIDVGL